MNARQKAKHYKRLYEQIKCQYVTPTIINTFSRKHYKTECRLPEWATEANISEEYIVDKFMKGLKPVIRDNMQRIENPWGTTFRLDFWI